MSVARGTQLALRLALVALPLYAWAAVAHYRAIVTPPDVARDRGWILGPSAAALERAADAAAERGLERLQDREADPARRVGDYRARLGEAQALLLRALRAQPVRASALARLAAVRWELGSPHDADSAAAIARMVDLATAAAPGMPEVHRRAGQLMLDLGRPVEAAGHLRRALELDPAGAAGVVSWLRGRSLPAERIRELLDGAPGALPALRWAFWEEGRETAYLAILEEVLDRAGDGPSPELITAYGASCLRLGDADRLVARLEHLGALAGPGPEAERLRWLARARMQLGREDLALADILAARRLQPGVAGLAELAGQVQLAAGRPEAALDAFRDALSLLARAAVAPAERARIYSSIGRARESAGQAARAYDAYRMALQLDPDEPHARRRMREMRSAVERR